jgi:Domain of unknown function (DUF4249)
MQKYSFFILLSTLLTSCTKIIDIDLNSSAPQIIIEGLINDETGPYTVKITKTINFSDPNNFPGVQNASVTILDDSGIKEVLKETKPGIYQTATLQGSPGKTYTLTVVAEGKTYTSMSKMPLPVDLKGIEIIENTINGGVGNDSTQFFDVQLYFKDDGNIKNFYRVVQRANGLVFNPFFNVTDDNLFNGQDFPFLIFNDEVNLKSGDSLALELHSMDKGAFDYFFSLGQTESGQSGTPANPVTNISGGALGYFSAYSVSKASGLAP